MNKKEDYKLNVPLNTRQDGGYIVGGAPSVLQNVETELTGSVDIGMEHLTDEFDARRLVGVLFLKIHHKAKGSILKGCIGWSNDNGIPMDALEKRNSRLKRYLHIPCHHIIGDGRGRDTCGGIGLHALKSQKPND